MKNIILNREEARELDLRAINDYGIPSIVLMENAGREIADYLKSLAIQGLIVICCGKGNNGGDGFVVARHLDNENFPVHVLLFSNPEELSVDANINYNIAVKSDIPITFVNEKNFDTVQNEILLASSWIVDALFGTGLQGEVRYPYNKIIDAINAANKNILAVDIPSGLDCDTGKPLGTAVKAQHTVTFVGLKKGFSNPEAKLFLGKIYVIDIGTPKKLIELFRTHDK